MDKFFSHGKLLITGEYVVLDGALALAIPTKYGQSLEVKFSDSGKLSWKSYDESNQIWHEDDILFGNNGITATKKDQIISERLVKILKAAQTLNPNFLNDKSGFNVETRLDFNKNWGLGTSSTLINNIANWAKIDAYKLLDLTFGGSGYDIACAQNTSAITYQLHNKNKEERSVNIVDFNPVFKDQLYFVYLNKKQNSRDGIAQYRGQKKDTSSIISEVSAITREIIDCSRLEEFNRLIDLHEGLIASSINMTPIKSQQFNDFEGSIKSLGAWGGDFILVSSINNPKSYFNNKGYHTVIPYTEMVL